MTDKQMAYQVYLNSQHWRRLRLLALERDGNKCVDCGATAGLQVHHWQYRDSPYQTRLQDVYTVCSACHEKAHKIKRNKAGRVVSMVQMPTRLKPVYADMRPIPKKTKHKFRRSRGWRHEWYGFPKQ